MKLRTQIAIITLGLAASTSLLWSAEPAQETTPTIQSETTPTIQGVWTTTIRQVNCNDPSQLTGFQFRAIITFHGDHTVELAGPPANSTNEYGVWKSAAGYNNYSYRDVSLQYDENGAYTGKGVVTAVYHLDTANTLNSTSQFEAFHANENLVFTG